MGPVINLLSKDRKSHFLAGDMRYVELDSANSAVIIVIDGAPQPVIIRVGDISQINNNGTPYDSLNDLYESLCGWMDQARLGEANARQTNPTP